MVETRSGRTPSKARGRSPGRKKSPSKRQSPSRRRKSPGNGKAKLPPTLRAGKERSLYAFLKLRVSIIFEEGSNVPPGSPPIPQFGLYALSSISFALLGLFAFLRFSCPVFPGHKIEAAVCVLQSLVSWGNDVYSFGTASKWKLADRMVASVNVAWQVVKLLWLSMAPLEYVVWIGAILAALACFQKGQECLHSRAPKAPTRANFDAFLYWHAAWHAILPSGAAAWMYLRGERLGCGCAAPWTGSCGF